VKSISSGSRAPYSSFVSFTINAMFNCVTIRTQQDKMVKSIHFTPFQVMSLQYFGVLVIPTQFAPMWSAPHESRSATSGVKFGLVLKLCTQVAGVRTVFSALRIPLRDFSNDPTTPACKRIISALNVVPSTSFTTRRTIFGLRCMRKRYVEHGSAYCADFAHTHCFPPTFSRTFSGTPFSFADLVRMCIKRAATFGANQGGAFEYA